MDECLLVAVQPEQRVKDVDGRREHLEELAKSAVTSGMSRTGLEALCLNH